MSKGHGFIDMGRGEPVRPIVSCLLEPVGSIILCAEGSAPTVSICLDCMAGDYPLQLCDDGQKPPRCYEHRALYGNGPHE